MTVCEYIAIGCSLFVTLAIVGYAIVDIIDHRKKTEGEK